MNMKQGLGGPSGKPTGYYNSPRFGARRLCSAAHICNCGSPQRSCGLMTATDKTAGEYLQDLTVRRPGVARGSPRNSSNRPGTSFRPNTARRISALIWTSEITDRERLRPRLTPIFDRLTTNSSPWIPFRRGLATPGNYDHPSHISPHRDYFYSRKWRVDPESGLQIGGIACEQVSRGSVVARKWLHLQAVPLGASWYQLLYRPLVQDRQSTEPTPLDIPIIEITIFPQ